MPQLDSNTFIYQYVGVIVLFIFIYSILSYLVLPVLLRSILFRNLFLTTRQTTTEVISNVSTLFSKQLSMKSHFYFSTLLNNFVLSFVNRLQSINKFLVINAEVSVNNSNVNTVTLTTEASLQYLVFFLLLNDDNTDIINYND